MAGICTVLGLREDQIYKLVKDRHLVSVGKGNATRYLDPTPEYAERLRLAENLHSRVHMLDTTVPTNALFTERELMYLTGWSQLYCQKIASIRKIKRIKLGRFTLISAETIRNMIWRKERKTKAITRSPFLLIELIEWFLKYKSKEDEETHSDAEYKLDDLFHRKLARMARMPSPGRELAMAEFFEKSKLAKTVANAVSSSSEIRPS